MNKNTLLFIFSVSAAIILLLVFSVNTTNGKINSGLDERMNKNILQELIDATGNQHVVINEGLKGKTTVLNVWATWCGPCLVEMPELNQMVEEFASEDIRFIALDAQELVKETEIMHERGIKFDYQLYFNEEAMIDLLYSFKLEHEGRAIPLHIIINKAGRAEIYHLGNQKENLDAMREYLSSL